MVLWLRRLCLPLQLPQLAGGHGRESGLGSLGLVFRV